MPLHPEDMSNLLSSHALAMSENSENDSQHPHLDHSDNIDGELSKQIPKDFVKNIYFFQKEVKEQLPNQQTKFSKFYKEIFFIFLNKIHPKFCLIKNMLRKNIFFSN